MEQYEFTYSDTSNEGVETKITCVVSEGKTFTEVVNIFKDFLLTVTFPSELVDRIIIAD